MFRNRSQAAIVGRQRDAGASKISPKVAGRSLALQVRFGLFAGEYSKKYLARAGANEIIES